MSSDAGSDGSGSRVLVTGATGFIGRAVADALAHAGWDVLRGARAMPAAERWVAYGGIGPDTRWDAVLAGVTHVVHCAGMAHVPDRDAGADAAAALAQRVNVEGTARLTAAAREAGVRRLLLVSSAQVHGRGRPGRPFSETDQPAPANAYARSKLAGEMALQRVAGRDMEWTILRPPLVYGPGARANFARLVRSVARGVPLPLGGATAPRSFLGVDNFASAVVAALGRAEAAGRVFLVSDREMSSTADLVRRLAAAMGRSVRLPAVPSVLMKAALEISGRGEDAVRLFEPMALNTAAIRDALGWEPPLSMDEGLRRAVAGMKG